MNTNRANNGYTCKKCFKNGNSPERKTPLYRRLKNKYKFIGKVECEQHGITDAIPLKEANRYLI